MVILMRYLDFDDFSLAPGGKSDKGGVIEMGGWTFLILGFYFR